MYLPLITELTIILVAALVGGIISRKLKLPVVAGYLVIGVVVSAIFQERIRSNQTIPVLANIGVALLLFSAGLEFSLDRLSKTAKNATIGASVQVFLTALISFFVFSRFLNLGITDSLILSFGISLSSTSIVLKLLNDAKETRTLHGELMIGWLIAQDLLTIPMFILIPIFANGKGNLTITASTALLKIGVIGYLILLLGRKFIPFFFERLARLSSKELMMVGGFALSLIFGILTESYFQSFAIGAFLAGVVLSASYVRFEIGSDMRPLRDIFSAVFFVTIGFLISPSFIVSHAAQIVFLTVFVLILKFLVIFLIVSYLGFHTRISFLASLGLLEVGEFAFVLARSGISHGVISENTYQLIVSTTVISLLLTSYFMSSSKKFYKVVKEGIRNRSRVAYDAIFTRFDKSVVSFPGAETELKHHVVLVGFGRVGKMIAKVLELSKVNFVVIDYDFSVLDPLLETKQPFVYGDPVDEDILETANLSEARLLVVAIPDVYSSEYIIRKAKKISSSVKIIGRAENSQDAKVLNSLGVKDVIEPEFEASLSMSEIVLEELMGDAKKGRKVLSEIAKAHSYA
ncbi:hypothetical protein A2716_00305 [candidate division WWE3 bacterium RIFCSPHIGHO2_01_FULL_40_23]|uniref:RCK N-terminal domain-containing protein n=1 Tax=candidate division WWE3 bacterium RIFCSPLOWO2_01_FULL_41_18 TaxID=1802625 RepID=A0A1F4VEP1_UNCKA|nr:MAG: hypothetical protein A2716_00305 [candidate division WWE3 bacterium RIFCSPHIGHO2_01_FULL_40_23]OGC55438.1 MAG: hypothetical protein A3A78_00575 [candidate division WWE3 bacterium RIFCSPLOWO2_01_FULL_41_18]